MNPKTARRVGLIVVAIALAVVAGFIWRRVGLARSPSAADAAASRHAEELRRQAAEIKPEPAPAEVPDASAPAEPTRGAVRNR